jgi:hypothetical protein
MRREAGVRLLVVALCLTGCGSSNGGPSGQGGRSGSGGVAGQAAGGTGGAGQIGGHAGTAAGGAGGNDGLAGGGGSAGAFGGNGGSAGATGGQLGGGGSAGAIGGHGGIAGSGSACAVGGHGGAGGSAGAVGGHGGIAGAGGGAGAIGGAAGVGTGGTGGGGAGGSTDCWPSWPGGHGGGAPATGGQGGGAPAAGGQGGGAPATCDTGGQSCSCPSDLSITVTGDGAPLSLGSGDASSLEGLDPGVIGGISHIASACLPFSRPWGEFTRGQLNGVHDVQACAGPGMAPPCLTLRAPGETDLPDSGYGSCGSWDSTYVDRDGHVFRGNVIASYRYTDLEQVAEGDYVIRLDDGRTLMGHFRVCLLHRIDVA